MGRYYTEHIACTKINNYEALPSRHKCCTQSLQCLLECACVQRYRRIRLAGVYTCRVRAQSIACTSHCVLHCKWYACTVLYCIQRICTTWDLLSASMQYRHSIRELKRVRARACAIRDIDTCVTKFVFYGSSIWCYI